ncbi:MAG TPA: hypothetical protein VIM16_02260 [Mucilaginibacter sp.]|jgi:hypothetical protein
MNRAKNKMHNCILAIVLFSIYSITTKGQNSPVKNSYTFDVSANSFINKTDLKINEGDKVNLSPSGTIVLRGVTGSSAPEGREGFANCRMDPVFPYGALLYKIGEDDWEIVNSDDTIVAERTGYLKFMVNDNDPTDNKGKYTVKVTVGDVKPNITQKIATVAKKAKVADHKTTAPNTSPHLPAGILTLSELEKASGDNLNDAKEFLTSKQFRFDDASNDHMHKYNFNKDNITASLVKDIKENQTTFETSSSDNYEEIKASLDKYGFKHRKADKEVKGVTKYSNSKYSLFIVLLNLNNKRQYFFSIKKL